MPDIFVAPENKDEEITHKRVPLESNNATPDIAPTKENQDFSKNEGEEIPDKNDYVETTPFAEMQADQEEKMQNDSNAHTKEHFHEDHRHPTIPLLTSFWQNPQGVYFDTQEVNEHILLFLRRHFITNVGWITSTIIFLVLPPIGAYLLSFVTVNILNIPLQFIYILIYGYYLGVMTNAFLQFLSWYYNISLITPKRVMDIELTSLVSKKISATKISLVQDINYQQSGTMRSVFNYGDVLIQTAGSEDNFYVNAVPKPEVVVRVVENLIGKGRNDEEDVSV